MINWSISTDYTDDMTAEQVRDALSDFVKNIKELKPDYGSLDTETNGLHIIDSRPFLVSASFANSVTKRGVSYTIELNNPFMKTIMGYVYTVCKRCKRVVFWNVKFDLHMLENKGIPYPYDNMTDALIYCRLAHDAVNKKNGGMPTRLKEYATKYITSSAKHDESLLKEEIKYKKKVANDRLFEALKRLPTPPQLGDPNTKVTKKIVDNYIKDKVHDYDDFDEPYRNILKQWDKEYNEASNYEYLNRPNLRKYAHFDTIYTLEAFLQALPVTINRRQEKTIAIEEQVIMPFYHMECTGFKFNIDYALDCKKKLKNYILQRRKDLWTILGKSIKITQHEVIKEILNDLGLETESTNKAKLRIALAENMSIPNYQMCEDIINIIEEIRTLEKWYSTYVCKWISEYSSTGRVYTQFNQTGAVSGRVSSDFQQFPSKPILDKDGNELFHPRKLVMVTGQGWNSILYLDYSSEELRFQALYTVFVSGGDLNFCRAFMPLQCHRLDEDNKIIKFDYDNPSDLKHYKEFEWHLNEKPEVIWTPTDLHAATAHAAFPDEPTDTPYFKNTLRKKYGKCTNFACTYGANINTLVKQFNYTEDMAKALYNGYYTAYPKINDYAKWVNAKVERDGFIENLFGRRYYGANGHKCRNYLVQGSAADFLKIKIRQLDDFLINNHCKSRLQMDIHDECSFEIYEGEEWIIPKLKEITEDVPGTKIPIIADAEITYTTWDEKEDFDVESISV